jgi:hypothetical protein
MTDPNRPPFFSYGSYPSSSDFQENEPAYSDWTSSQFPQAHFGPQINYEPVPSYVENPAGPRLGAGERSLNSKVAIPRSANPSSWTSSGRVSRACENCREQKAKCSGHRPTCQRCQESGIRCSYGDRKREKMAKCVFVNFASKEILTVDYRQLSELTNQVQVYEALLRDIYPKLEPQSAQYVEQVLNEVRTTHYAAVFCSGLTDITAKPGQRPILWPTNCNAISGSQIIRYCSCLKPRCFYSGLLAGGFGLHQRGFQP